MNIRKNFNIFWHNKMCSFKWKSQKNYILTQKKLRKIPGIQPNYNGELERNVWTNRLDFRVKKTTKGITWRVQNFSISLNILNVKVSKTIKAQRKKSQRYLVSENFSKLQISQNSKKTLDWNFNQCFMQNTNFEFFTNITTQRFYFRRTFSL